MSITRYASPRRIKRRVHRMVTPTEAVKLAKSDAAIAAGAGSRVFSEGTRPVIRWIKGDGLDDDVTRAAIGAATRIFGTEVDYCLCTYGISPARARKILAWADRPVELWPLSPEDNPRLAERLQAAGCAPQDFGYWWKWFPERVRPGGPEWILDGDMVITARPEWFDAWAAGTDGFRISQDDTSSDALMYGRYAPAVESDDRIYSGLASLPPGRGYQDEIDRVLDAYPLEIPHHGCTDMDEQGVIATAFQGLNSKTFPLDEFPFCRSFEDTIDYGSRGGPGNVWGYHFGWSFRMPNHHFDAMTADGTIYSQDEPGEIERFNWLRNEGQWGIPGWSLNDDCTAFILDAARPYAGCKVLELGTSRGRMAAMLSSLGCRVTTIDHVDRGARANLEGLNTEVVISDARRYLRETDSRFDFIVADFHDNSPKVWKGVFPQLRRILNPGGRIAINNAWLWKLSPWQEETGVRWLLRNLPDDFVKDGKCTVEPGVVILRHV